ncbi:MAG: class I SAM-dependent methyltransferase [Eubacteriales bacterium]|nr:class I SAM-dependent methyltransferase [Eubacteriales bacterium]
MLVTTARKPSKATEAEAREIAAAHGIPCLPRGNRNLESLLREFNTVLVLSDRGLSCFTPGGELFFHPNMAAVRIRLLRQGKEDKMLDICELTPGDSFLDCTAGLCSDSLVAKYQVGEKGRVLSLEQSLPIYLVMLHGLKNANPPRFRELARGIELVHADFRSYLQQLPPRSFDVVYFDPMFDVPVLEASSLMPLRPLACDKPLTPGDIDLAARVARRRVVVKQRSFFDFSRLGMSQRGGPRRKTAYGVLEIKENENGF